MDVKSAFPAIEPTCVGIEGVRAASTVPHEGVSFRPERVSLNWVEKSKQGSSEKTRGEGPTKHRHEGLLSCWDSNHLLMQMAASELRLPLLRLSLLNTGKPGQVA